MPKLIVLKGPDAGKQFPLDGEAVSVGRHSKNAIALRDDRVSRRHLELQATTAGYQVVDLGSGNGTLVNGRPVRSAELRSGDQIAIGDTLLVYAANATSGLVPPPGRTGPTEDGTRIVVRPTAELPSAILRTVAEDAGSRILARPQGAASDWLRTRLAHLTVLYEATGAVSHILDVDELLGRVVELVVRTTEADHGCAVEIDTETGDYIPKAVRTRANLSRAAVPAEFVVSRTVIDHVLKNKQGVLVADAGADERFRGGESVARHQLREVICVPMKGRHETVGVLFLDTCGKQGGRGKAEGGNETSDPPSAFPLPSSPMKFTDDHLHLAVAVAHQAALAIEETRYYRMLVQAERLAAVGQTIAALSHHIKNIMQGVRFGSDMVRMGLSGDDRELLTKGWRLVEKNQTKIDHLILDMLSYSKDREPAFEETDLNGIVADVLDVVRGRANDSGVSLDWRPMLKLPPVSCDPDGIHRAVLNVVSNAVDAVEGHNAPRVTVATALVENGAFAEVSVTDNGEGISPEKIGEIFKPFVSTKGARGTGLGLPVSRKILREHGGDVTVTGTPGQGSRFALRIPMKQPGC